MLLEALSLAPAFSAARAEDLSDIYGRLVPQFVDPALIQTFLLYDHVLWYTDQLPSLGVAQRSVFPYLQNGGRVIFSTMFLNTTDPRGALRDFAPIDSVSSVDLSAATRPLRRRTAALKRGLPVLEGFGRNVPARRAVFPARRASWARRLRFLSLFQ